VPPVMSASRKSQEQLESLSESAEERLMRLGASGASRENVGVMARLRSPQAEREANK